MGKESNKPSKYTAVCSLHFTADDYLKRPGTYVQRLKPNAVPSIIVQGAARIMPIVKEEINVTNIDGPSTSSNNIMDPLGAIVPFVADNTDVLTDCIVLPIESAENKRQLEVNSDDEPLKKKNTSDTPRKVKLKRIVKTLRQKILRKEKKIKSMKQLLGTLTTIVKQ
ncbi:hypothetical protein WN55_10028 [Dufourea novaeangliae]|uniref:THAP-type domain-containing protein n=2 Tax=Dufourea novaeangliae TaxID=178035 RepID=A0A154P8H1_DUFNO|nr:hypothetical protein WN55_10028 [Dufourea novaeangliae]